jgi:hypothetical protein
MRALYSWWLGVATAGTVLAGALYVGGTHLAQTGWSGGPSEVERLDRLTTDFECMARRQEGLRYLATDVADGRMTLREAAAAVRVDDLSSPPHLRMHVEYLPGRSEEERYCRSLLGHVRTVLEGDPRAPSTLARLEGELRAVAQGLPAPPRRAGRRLPPPPEVLTMAPAAEVAQRGQPH